MWIYTPDELILFSFPTSSFQKAFIFFYFLAYSMEEDHWNTQAILGQTRKVFLLEWLCWNSTEEGPHTSKIS